MSFVQALLIFMAAAVLEVGGDAMIRKGLRGGGLFWQVVGCLVLAAYGIVVNKLSLNFAKLMGLYVGAFALVSVLTALLFFHERIPLSTWVGVLVILGGGLLIQFGPR
ncbi:MAG TPA: hypothetical protein VMM92_11490 [Thermoanaerobaculia bacterium]|nr:hypothetical protein [Thermoanaerobaculia bacterium]